MLRIVWNHSEKTAVFDEMVKLLIEEPHMHPRDVLARCQIVLPTNRRRDVSYNMVFNYKSTVHKAGVKANSQRAKQHVKTVEEKPEPAPTTDVLEQVMKKLAVMVADEIQRRYPTPFYIQHPSSKPPEQKVAVVAVEEVKTSLPTNGPGVLVIGLNGNQMSLVKSRFPRKDIMFLHVDDAKSYNPVRREHTILMTKFINHAVQERYRNAPNLQYCNGGISELSKILINIR